MQSLAQNYASYHIHAVIGDYIGELIAVRNTLGIDPACATASAVWYNDCGGITGPVQQQ